MCAIISLKSTNARYVNDLIAVSQFCLLRKRIFMMILSFFNILLRSKIAVQMDLNGLKIM